MSALALALTLALLPGAPELRLPDCELPWLDRATLEAAMAARAQLERVTFDAGCGGAEPGRAVGIVARRRDGQVLRQRVQLGDTPPSARTRLLVLAVDDLGFEPSRLPALPAPRPTLSLSVGALLTRQNPALAAQLAFAHDFDALTLGAELGFAGAREQTWLGAVGFFHLSIGLSARLRLMETRAPRGLGLGVVLRAGPVYMSSAQGNLHYATATNSSVVQSGLRVDTQLGWLLTALELGYHLKGEYGTVIGAGSIGLAGPYAALTLGYALGL